ncbi:MAG TPA: ATP-grasp domain-containing protein [Candidatus Saccharimonadales bacterium]|nr:ATP-grasp domain-containing protein [Candidatus Saccharimonadales bacterium]
MKLYEFEGHKIFAKVGLASPFFVVCSNMEEVEQARKRIKFPIVAKVQVLSGKRGKSGGVKICANEKQLTAFCKEMFGKEFSGEEVRFIQLSEKVEIEEENYISITYDTVAKIPFMLFSKRGGMDIEEVRKTDPGAIVRLDIDPFDGPKERDLVTCGIPVDFAMRLWDAFVKYDCRLVEVNPLARQGASSYVAVDAKVILDDSGLSRHKDLDVLPKGAVAAVPTERELLAHEIDAEDYRGTAGSKFIEFEGDIAILASGGGASLLVMDALYNAGGLPANYTEYSGNPPREKVEKLTKIALSREGLSGCLVAGAVANFTDIFETLSGFAEGLRQVKPKPDYPIVVRRGGPRLKEAYEMLETFAKKEGFDIHMFGPETPISVASKKMVELTKKFKTQNSKLKSTSKK